MYEPRSSCPRQGSSKSMPLPRRHLLSAKRSCASLSSGPAEEHNRATQQALLTNSINHVSKITAVESVRRMRGGSQSHLMRCSDGGYYVVKFQNNPQGCRVLANELLGSLLARLIGLCVSQVAIVEVSETLIRHTDDMVIEREHGRTPCRSGLCFGSRFPEDCTGTPRAAYDYLPRPLLQSVENLADFAGMLVFDKWTSNTDGRQVVFSQQGERSTYRATMIDQGFCFHGNEWDYRDAPVQGLYHDAIVYSGCTSFETFEPWLSKVEKTDKDSLRLIGDAIPAEWYQSDAEALGNLLGRLYDRRNNVRDLLRSTIASRTQTFPNWSAPRSEGVKAKAAGAGAGAW